MHHESILDSRRDADKALPIFRTSVPLALLEFVVLGGNLSSIPSLWLHDEYSMNIKALAIRANHKLSASLDIVWTTAIGSAMEFLLQDKFVHLI